MARPQANQHDEVEPLQLQEEQQQQTGVDASASVSASSSSSTGATQFGNVTQGGTSTTSMIIIGVVGVAILVGAYFLFKKKP
jgi:LPXTG-motif cell wall-anchored protein